LRGKVRLIKGGMDWNRTLSALAIALSLTLICGWLGARPPDPARGPRLIPYRFLMLLGGAVVIFLLIHAAALAGLRPERG